MNDTLLTSPKYSARFLLSVRTLVYLTLTAVDPLCIVVTEDVSEDNSIDLFTFHSVCRYLIQLFFFQCGKEALHTSVVIAVSSTAEALDESVCYKLLAEGVACVLAATVAVKDSSIEPAVLLTQLFYGVYAKFFLHVVTHFKSDYLTIEAVEYR